MGAPGPTLSGGVGSMLEEATTGAELRVDGGGVDTIA